jgi:Fe2+ or Zn2+ uptake regulation protein/O6-methylguanine-DNA--protein-cysteine methyltransferase
MARDSDYGGGVATASLDRLGRMADDAIADLLRERDLRVTPQRRAILQAFRGRSDEHLAADEVLSRASTIVPEISRGTVYAALAELTELGLLASVGTPEPVRYETNLERHDHFHCRLCLRLFDVDIGGGELSRRSLDGYQVESVAIRAEGVCAQCRDYERGLIAGAAAVMRRRTLEDSALAQLTCMTISTPLGGLGLAASSDGIVRVAFEDHADFPGLQERARTRRGSLAGRRRLGEVAETLQMYFGGSHHAIQDSVDWRLSTAGSAEALLSVHAIPYGVPLSYEKLHGELSAYDRGYTMGSNPVPLMIPCHRVSCGSLRPEAYVGGARRLRLLRELEIA